MRLNETLGARLPEGTVYTQRPLHRGGFEWVSYATTYGWLYLELPLEQTPQASSNPPTRRKSPLRVRSLLTLYHRQELLKHLEALGFTVLERRFTLIDALDPEGKRCRVWGGWNLRADTVSDRLRSLQGLTYIAHPEPYRLTHLLRQKPWIRTLPFVLEETSANAPS